MILKKQIVKNTYINFLKKITPHKIKGWKETS